MAEVLPAHVPDGQPYFTASPLSRSSSSSSSLFVGSPPKYTSRKSEYMQSNSIEPPSSCSSPSPPYSPRSPPADISHDLSFRPTIGSGLSLNTRCDESEYDDILFPTYETNYTFKPTDRQDSLQDSPKEPPPEPPNSPAARTPQHAPSPHEDGNTVSTSSTPISFPLAEDDTAIKQEPSHHVDYLSHDWREEDIWSSWRHIVSKRKLYGEVSRLENASWRTWAKSKYKLSTVSPATLNWLKDCDVTWLYGPLQTASNPTLPYGTSEPASRMSRTNSFTNKKPILKKRSVSELMLQKSLSNSSLIKQAAAAIQAQQNGAIRSGFRERPSSAGASYDHMTSTLPSKTMSRDGTDYFSSSSTSGLQTPEQGERKHISWDPKVEQCIAVDCKDGDYDEDDEDNFAVHEDDNSSDDDVVMMKQSKRMRTSRRSSLRSSFSGESKTIAKLPPTTLRSSCDSPDIDHARNHSLGFPRNRIISPSASQETLRPTKPSNGFLLDPDDEGEGEDMSWEPSSAFSDRYHTIAARPDQFGLNQYREGSGGLRRTESGMFMPCDDDEDEMMSTGIFGKVIRTVNTMKDIGFLVWNQGWTSG